MARRHMRDLVVVDRLERPHALRVARPAELLDRARVHVEPARLVHEVDDREPRAQRRERRLRGLPQPRVHGERAVGGGGGERGEARGEQGEVFGLVQRHLGEVCEEGGREIGVRGAVARDDVPPV